MHDGDSMAPHREPYPSRGATGVLAALALVGTAAVLQGCGGGSDDDALSEFEGSWRISVNSTLASDFHLTCPMLPFDGQFSLFNDMVLARGTVTDLYESAGPGSCQFGFNVVPKMKALSIANPDPFTVMAPSCLIDLGQAGTTAAGDRVDTQVSITPVSWLFNLVAPVKGQPPRAQFIVHAIASIDSVDVDVTPPMVLTTNPCTYDIKENLEKVSRL